LSYGRVAMYCTLLGRFRLFLFVPLVEGPRPGPEIDVEPRYLPTVIIGRLCAGRQPTGETGGGASSLHKYQSKQSFIR